MRLALSTLASCRFVFACDADRSVGAPDAGSPAGDASAERAEPPALTCHALASKAVADTSKAVEDAGRTCSASTDCALVWPSPRCGHSCAVATAVSVSGVASIEASLAAIDEGICVDFTDAGCSARAPCPEDALPFDCIEERCEVLPTRGCDDCITRSVTFYDVTFAETTTHSFIDCASLESVSFDGGVCRAALPPCGNGLDVGAVLSALDHPDVAIAFAEGGFFGSEASISREPLLSVTVEGQEIIVGGQCALTEDKCRWVPGGVTALVALLRRFAMEVACAR